MTSHHVVTNLTRLPIQSATHRRQQGRPTAHTPRGFHRLIFSTAVPFFQNCSNVWVSNRLPDGGAGSALLLHSVCRVPACLPVCAATELNACNLSQNC